MMRERSTVRRGWAAGCSPPSAANRTNNLLWTPAASLADRVADLPDQSVLGVVFEARRDGERADRAHRYVLDPAILAPRFVRPFSDQDTRIRNRPCLVKLFVQLLEDLLLGAVIHASRNVDVGDGHLLSPVLVSRISDVVMKGGGRAAASSRYRAALAAGRAGHRGRAGGHSASHW